MTWPVKVVLYLVSARKYFRAALDSGSAEVTRLMEVVKTMPANMAVTLIFNLDFIFMYLG